MEANIKQQSITKDPRLWFGLTVTVFFVVLAIFAPWIAPYKKGLIILEDRLCSPNLSHWFGCDLNGGDVLSSTLYGAQVSLFVGFMTVLISSTVGIFVGMISGYFGGKVDHYIMRGVDILMAFPGMLLALSLAAILGPSVTNVVIVLSATGWISTARLVRGQVLSVKEREYVQSIQALGGSLMRISLRHILPNILAPILVHTTFTLAGVIIVEASLSFLGVGTPIDSPSWGQLLAQGKNALTEAPWLTLAPGICIMILVMGINFLGDALRDYYDPK